MPVALPKSSPAFLVGLLAVLVAAPSAYAAGSAARSKDAWSHVSPGGARRTPAQPLVAPRRYAAFTLDQSALAGVLKAAPAERRRAAAPASGAGLTISVPTPDGGFERFDVVDSPVMAPGLAAAHPDIKTYSGRGVDDPSATVRLDVTPIGFHASVRDDDGSWYVDPRYRDRSEYVAYDRDAIAEDPATTFAAPGDDELGRPPTVTARPDAARANGAAVTLRTYRLALVSDPTYAAAVGAANVTAAKVALMNRVDQIYERDLAIRMVLIDGNDALNLDTAAKATGTGGPCGSGACFTSAQLGSCQDTTLTRNTLVAARIAGAGSYDIAHLVLGTNGGGLANLGVVGGPGKGRGCTGIPTPTGDAFAVDYVAHEMGHQFGADHTFNGNAATSGTEANCGPSNRSATQAVRVEPGGGSSIMAYAGICGQDDLQAHSDPYFSQASVTQIGAYVAQAETNASSTQQAVLSGTPSSFTLKYNGQTSTTITSYTSTAIRNAIQAIAGWPAGGTVSVSGVNSGGFTVTFGGTLANKAVGALAFGSIAGATGFIGEFTSGGATRVGGTAEVTGNHAPNVSTPAAFTIPKRTPFLLDATGSDSDGDPLTYLWEQNDPGGATGTPLVSNAKANGPLFRVFGTAARYGETAAHQSPSPGENAATSQTWRSFPDPLQVAADNTDAATGSCPAAPGSGAVPAATVDCYSEFLPTSAWVGVNNDRTLHFRVTARDNDPTAGGVGSADTALTVAPAAGPFRVTSQASPASATTGGTVDVTWDVAGTGAGTAVNAAQVEIQLSTDGGATFPYTLDPGTANDGSATVTLPRVTTTQGRIRVMAVGNVFYDVSKANLTITTTDPVLLQAPASADLGSAGVGGQGADTVVTFTNAGTGTAHPTAPVISGTDASAVVLSADTCSGAALASGATCAVTLHLHPTRPGAQSATLSLSTAEDPSSTTVALTGNGQTAPSLVGPASASLGTATVGSPGADTVVTFTNSGSGSATVGAATLSGPDAAAVARTADSCSSRPLAVGASCAITLRLTPTHDGDQAATLTLTSDDPAGPRTVALTGTGTPAPAVVVTPPPGDTINNDNGPVGRPAPVISAPAPGVTAPVPTPTPVSPATIAERLAATLLGVDEPYKLGKAGDLSLFATTKSTKLGKPRASKVIAAAACAGGTCAGTATAKLTLTPKAKGKKKVVKTIVLAKALKLGDGQAARLTLKLSAKDRKAIKAAGKATVTLTVTNATKKISRTYTLTVG
ncbi:MAG TPA: M12 family metallo-peptidase [Baekduia sp.]|uniref:M12 family metallo-peptidase n=1 Tax=Baekduia sp. TaxID=2600305 RepID=UPI002D7A26AC|nr:M12 family metallo-peptidase [Baekduia sp.]HET6507333.1 M12 family metallo-peptidase [Baekduia sp.]